MATVAKLKGNEAVEVVTAGLPNKEQNMLSEYVLIRIKRPEGYEDVHPELILQDANINPAFEPEIVTGTHGCRPGSVCSRSIRGLGGCEAGICEREEGVPAAPAPAVQGCGFYDDKCERTCSKTPAADCLLKAEMEYLSWLYELRTRGVDVSPEPQQEKRDAP